MAIAKRWIEAGSADERFILAAGGATGVGLALLGLRPTGQALIDVVLLIVAGLGAVWALARAPWWALGALAGIAAALAPLVWPMLLGLVVFGLSLAVGLAPGTHPRANAAIAGGSILVLAEAREIAAFGVSTAVGVLVVVVLGAIGIWRRPHRERRMALAVVAGAATFVALAVLGFAVAAASAKADLTDGNRAALQGVRELQAGQFDLAQDSFERAAGSFERADRDLSAPWAQPARLVPVLSQHRMAGATLADAAADATVTIEHQLEQIDFDALRVVDSRIDVDAVTGLAEPLRELQVALEVLDDAVRTADSPWLVSPIRRKLDELEVEITDQRRLGDKADAALEVAPDLLGASGPRVYLLMFTTPGEARGRVGFMGNYAELTIDAGRISVTAFGGHDDLSAAGELPRRLTEAPPDWLARYGSFGFTTGPDGTVGTPIPWTDITMSPHFPYTAQVVAELYPQSGGRAVDGVISVDVFAVERLVELIGAIELDEVGQPLTGANTAQFLLLDQYQIPDRGQRRDLLALVARELIDRLLADAPDPLDLGRALAPMVRQDRVLAWSPNPAVQDLFDSIGMDGRMLADLGGGDGYGVTVANATNNKIETFLDRDVSLTRIATSQGAVDELRITLHNDAPTDGFPPYVIGNTLGLPLGTTRIYLTVSTTAALLDAAIDGQPAALHPGTEAGFKTYSTFVTIDAQGSATIDMRLEPSAPDEPAVFDEQPLVRPARWNVLAERGTAADP